MDAWVSFDCYGTLIDWHTGISHALGSVWPSCRESGSDQVVEFLRVEASVTKNGSLTYREVLTRTLQEYAAQCGLALDEADACAVADSLSTWEAFPEVTAELTTLRRAGWRLAILSNTDPDYLAASIESIGVPIDLTVIGSEIGSYKPAHRHWEELRRITGVGRDEYVHVAASVDHDIEPCAQLGISAIYINRAAEQNTFPTIAELPNLNGLAATLDRHRLPDGS